MAGIFGVNRIKEQQAQAEAVRRAQPGTKITAEYIYKEGEKILAEENAKKLFLAEQESKKKSAENAVTQKSQGIPAGSYTQQKPTYNEPVDNRTTQQKFDDAQKAYDSYMGSDERKQALGKVNLQTAIQQLFNVAGGPTSDALPGSASAPTAPQDAKERELSATVEHYRQQLQAEEDQRIMDEDLKELESWSEEDRNNLNRYIAERDQHAYNSLNPMIGPQFDTYNLNPIVEKYGIDKVRRMAETVKRNQNAETMGKVEETAQNTANNRPWLGGTLGSVASIPANLAGALTGPLGYVVEAGQRTGRYSTLDPNNLGNLPSVYGETVRSEVAQNIRGDEDSTNWLRKLAALGYQGGMSALDSGARLLASGGSSGISSALAASGAFGNGLRQYSQQGADPAQAAAMALVNAGFEYATEKIPTEKMLTMFKKGNRTGAVREILKQAFLVEPTSEEVNLFSNVAAEAVILGEKSSKSQRVGELIANGMSYEEAQVQVYKELMNEAVQTYAVSAFAGFLGSSSATVFGNAVNGNPQTETQPQAAPASPVVDEKTRAQQIIEATAADIAKNAPATPPAEPLTVGQQLVNNAAAELFGVANRQSVVDTVSTERYDKNRTQEGGNFDVGREVRENQNWPINQSGSGIRGAEVAGESGTGNSQISGEGSISGRGGEVFQGGDYSVEYDDEYDHYDGRPTKDGAGNEISGETAKRLAGTTVLDKNNAPIAVFHGTPNMEFTAFEQGDSGFHFGNYEQAKRRIEGKNLEEGKRSKAGRVFRTYLNIKNPIYAEDDIGSWDAPAVAMLLETYGVLNTDEANSVKNLQGNGTGYNSPAAVQLRNLMDAKGYDGIVYPNYIEGKGDSYMVFHNDQIVQSNIQYLDDDGNAYADASGSRYKDPKTGKPVIKGTGAAEQNFSGKAQYQDLLYEGNVQRDRPGDVRPMEVPKKDTYNRNVSEFVGDAYGAEITPNEMANQIEELVQEGALGFDRRSNQDALNDAAAAIKAKGVNPTKRQITINVAKGKLEDGDIEKAMLLYASYANKNGIRAQESAAEILVDLTTMAHMTGRNLQLFKLLRRMTPEGQLMAINQTVQRNVESMKRTGQVKKDYEPQLDPELLHEYEKAAEERANAETEEQRQEAEETMQETQEAIFAAEASKMPATFKAKWDAWRYMSMLGNAKTQVRNLVGNLAFMPYKTVKDKMAAIFEKALPKEQRTKAIGTDFGLLAWAKADAKTTDINNALKYSAKLGDDVTSAQFAENKKVFDSKALDGLRKFVEKVPQAGDMIFKNDYYARSLASFLKARGYNAEAINSGKVNETVLAEARGYAIQEAMKATFNDCNAFSDAIANLRYKDPDTAWKKAINIAGESILPFRRTPANIIARFEEYSPLGIINTVYKAAKHIKNGDASAASVIDSLASTFTGTGAFLLGIALAKGIGNFKITGSGTDEDEKRQGHQDYAVEFSVDGQEYSYKIDWAAPANLPLFVGANLYKAWSASGEDVDISKMSELIHAFGTSFEPILSLSCMSSFNDLFEGARYARQGEALYSVATDIATSYLTQAIPALLRQTYQATQENKQTTFANSEDATTRDLQKIGAQIPFVGAEFQTDKVNAWGETETTESGWMRALNAYFNPGTLKEISDDPVEKELNRLNEAQVENVSPPTTDKTVSYTDTTGQKHDDMRLTEEQYQTLATTQGQTAKRLLDKLIKSKDYKVMTDSQKAAAVNAVYEYAAEAGKKAALPDYYSNAAGWIGEAEEDPVNSIIRRGAEKMLESAVNNTVKALSKGWTVTSASKKDLNESFDSFEKLSEENRQMLLDTITGDTLKYLEIRSGGVNTDDYLDAVEDIKKLDPEEGYSEVRDVQKREAIAASGLDPKTVDVIMKAYMKDYDPEDDSPDKTELRYDYARQKLGLNPEQYAKVYRVQAEGGKKAEKIAAWMALGYSKQEATTLYNLFAATGNNAVDVVSWYNAQ